MSTWGEYTGEIKGFRFETKAEKKCPPATQDIAINIKNRQKAIQSAAYGPLNPKEPNDKFWQESRQMGCLHPFSEEAEVWKLHPLRTLTENP